MAFAIPRPGKKRVQRAKKFEEQLYEPLPHQVDFHTNPSKYRAMVSGVGGGKTRMGVQEIQKWAQLYPGGRFLVGRLTSSALRETTQKTFFDMLNPALIAQWQETRGRLLIKTREPDVYSEILFRHLDEPGPLGSLDIDGFWIDEAHEPDGKEVPESTFLMLQARLRGVVGPLRGFVTTNSGGRDWVYHWFFSPNRRDKNNYYGTVVKTRENPYLPDGYEEMLRANNPDTWVKRFLDASFDVFEGQIFTEFDEQTHTVDKADIDVSQWNKEAGFDFGISAPTAIIVGRQDPSTGLVVITDEYHQSEANISVVAGWIRAHGFTWVWADPSTRNRGVNKVSPADAYLDEGVTLQPALTNDDDTKIMTVHQYLLKGKLLICKNCESLIDSLKSQKWNPNIEGKRLKQNDHAFDGLAYLLVSLNPIGGWLDVWDMKKRRDTERKNSGAWEHPSIQEDEEHADMVMGEAEYIDFM